MNLITYQSHKYGLQIQYPDDWNKTEKDITESDSTIVSFYSPNAAEVIITIAVTLEPKDMALDTFVQQHIKNLRDNYSDFKILQSRKSWLSSLDDNDNDTENTLAHILICSFEGLTFHYFMTLGKSLAHATNIYYTITYMAALGKYRRYLPIAEQMIRSIRIT
ncbi:MAG TPA: hypothetical protein VJ729_03010 [Nitrososphaeraceae archaeon]|nr:hypothetical protein [Nitrososphaeraceae archaeon]